MHEPPGTAVSQKARLSAVFAEPLPAVTFAVPIRLCPGRMFGTSTRIRVLVPVFLALMMRLDSEQVLNQSQDSPPWCWGKSKLSKIGKRPIL